jgi:cysteinyl-tRNA synthetase
LHGEFLELDKAKMSKSSGSLLHLDRIMADGFSPLDYRYLLLTTHYRSRLRFSYESLEAAKRTRAALLGLMQRWRRERDGESAPNGKAVAAIKSAFCEHLDPDIAAISPTHILQRLHQCRTRDAGTNCACL